MFIETLQVKNFCQFKENKIEFSPGLNAIVGPNGSGKTNTLNSIVFSVTGDLSRLHGLKKENIYSLAGEDEKASVALTFRHGQTKGQIIRTLQPDSQELSFEGQEHKFTRAADISREMTKLLGVNERMLLDYVFVSQWGIFSFVDQKPNVRAKAFGELFGANKAEDIYEDMGKYKIAIPAVAVNGDQLKSRLANLEKEQELLQLELEQYRDLPEKWSVDNDVKWQLYQQWLEQEQASTRRQQVVSKLTEVTQNLQVVKKALYEKAEEETVLRTTVRTCAAQATDAQAKLQMQAVYDENQEKVKVLSQQIATLEAELKDLHDNKPEPLKVLTDVAFDLAEHTLDELNLRIKQLKLYIKVAESNEPACPTCGTPGEAIKAHLEQYKQDVERLTKEAQELDQNIQQVLEQNRKLTIYYAKVKIKEIELKQRQNFLAVLDLNIGAPVANKEQLEELVRDYDIVKELYAEGQQAMNKLREQLATEQGKKQELDEQYTRLEQFKHGISEEQAKEAKAHVEKMGNDITTRDRITFRLADLAMLRLQLEEDLKQVSTVQTKAGYLTEHTQLLDNIRQGFKELPRLTAQHHLEELRTEINEVLELFNARFRVQIIDNLRFMIKFHSGRVQTAERLSGGERVMFALAFRIVINSKYAKDLGLLCLDEPTAGLDEDNMSCLEVALGRLRELSQARGLQVLLVTHDMGLDGLFDRVIRLQAAS